MRINWARHGLLTIAAGVTLWAAGIAMAQDTARVMPQPRPPELTTPQNGATPAATETEESAGPAAQSPDVPTDDLPAPSDTTMPQGGPAIGPVTGFPIPRYVSLKAAEANARRGPSRSHRIDWVFQRRNMPVMVVAEHGHWRRIVDRDGAGGWVHYTLLSGERTVIVDADMLPILVRPDPDASVRAEAERDVIAELRQCSDGWCEIEAGGFRGWVEATGLWGVDPGETID